MTYAIRSIVPSTESKCKKERVKKGRMEGGGEPRNLLKVWSTAFLCLTFCYFVVRKIPKGLMRLLILLPVVFVFTYLPLQLSSLHLITIAMFFLAWLGNFKLLLFAFDQGPLSSNPSISFLHFICIGCLPIQIKQENRNRSPPEITKKGLKSPLNYIVKVLLLALLIKTFDYKLFVPPYLLFIPYCFHLYLLEEIVLAIAAVPARVLFSFEIEPQFNEPYFSTSLQDFWGRRWNLMVTHIMRPTVYQPLLNISTPIVGRTRAIVVGSMGTFVVSGLMHELLYFHLSRLKPTWEVTGFFVLHGVCTSLEMVAKKHFGKKWKLHPLISGMLTIVFIGVTGFWLFFPQLLRNRLDVRAIGEYTLLVNFIMGLVRLQGP